MKDITRKAEWYADGVHLCDVECNNDDEKGEYLRTHPDNLNLLHICSRNGFIAGASWQAGEDKKEIEREAIAFAEWIAEVNVNGINNDPNLRIILCDGEYYWESDKDGDQPISEQNLYHLFKQNNP